MSDRSDDEWETLLRHVSHVAAEYICVHGGLANLPNLIEYPGWERVDKALLTAVVELGRRVYAPHRVMTQFSQPEDIAEAMRAHVWGASEVFVVFYLNPYNHVLAEMVLPGTPDGVAISIRMVLERALKVGACAMVAAHTHPSGRLEPSTADDEVTKELQGAGRLLGVPLLDHVIVTKGEFYSYMNASRIV